MYIYIIHVVQHVLFRISIHPSICLSVFMCMGVSVLVCLYMDLNVMTYI